MTELKIDPGDKIWFLRPGRINNSPEGQAWICKGPYEPDAEMPTDEELHQTFVSAGFAAGFIIYKVVAPDESTARGIAIKEHRAACQRRRDEAAARYAGEGNPYAALTEDQP